MRKIILSILMATIACLAVDNTTVVSGATAVKFYLGNYPYTNISTMPNLSIRLASDLGRLFYSDASGVKRKILTDASTSSNTAVSRLFFADVNGAASSSANLTFASDKLSITGKLTLSDSINGANAKFTGRVTGTDVEVSDSVKAVSGAFSGALSSSTLVTTGNVIIGTSGLFNTVNPTNITMDGTYNNTNNPWNLKFYLMNIPASRNVFGFGVTETRSEMMYQSLGGHVFYVDSIARATINTTGLATDSLTTPILRGNVVTRGDFTVSKKVLTDTVRSVSGNARLVLQDDNNIDLNATSVNVNGALVVHDTLSFQVNFLGFTNSPIVTMWKYEKIGGIISVVTNLDVYETSNGTGFYATGALPVAIRPNADVFVSAATVFYDGGANSYNAIPILLKANGDIELYKPATSAGLWTASSNKGYNRFCFTYTKR